MIEFQVEFYANSKGEQPAKDFILRQPVKMRAKLLGLIQILEEYGTQLREPYSAPLADGIFELRCKQGSDITRVLYFFYCEGKIVLTNGFAKKTQKTPKKVIELAKKYRADYMEGR